MAERLLNSDADRVRGWLDVLSRLNTIRSRLYLAFGLAAGMTVVGSLFALYASANISATMTEIVSRSMPATVESLRLAEEASTLVASAPRLMTASDDNRRDEIARDIAAQSQMLSDRIARLRQLDAGQNDEIEVARAAMVERLDALNQAVTERLKISAQRRALALSVRKVHEDILEAITPAIDDANFDLMTRNQASGGSALNQSIEALRRLLEVQSGINLLSGLLIESSMVTDVANLAPMRDPMASAQRSIEGNLKALPQIEQTKKIADLYQKLAAVAGSDGIVTQRTNELNREQDARQVYAAATAEAARLRKAVEGPIERQGKFAQALSGRAISQIRVGRILLVILSIAALAAAGLIAWLYVGRSIVGRLTLLSGAMRRIADGESNVAVPVGGQDEIAGMAKALLVFRQAIAEVSVARQREADRADANGNTLTDPSGKSYTWDYENHLISAIVPGTGTVTFKYDAFGRRIQKSSWLGIINYLYDGPTLIEELDNSGNVQVRYASTRNVDEPLAELRSGTTAFYEQDGLGSVTSLSSSTGALANTYNYDGFGKLTASTGTLTNPFQFTGREFDAETGLHYYRARYYNSASGTFLSEDPLGFLAGPNFYDYVGNQPIVYSDPTGLNPGVGFYLGSGASGGRA